MIPNPLVDSRDLRFVLFEMLGMEKLSRFDAFASFDRDAYEATLDLAEKLALERIYPANAPSDREGATYDPATKEVRVPAGYREALARFNEAGLTGLANDPAWGGMGMPDMMYRAVMEYVFAASVAFGCYVSLSIGATNLVKNFAPEALKKLCLEKMIAGRWGGTMCLTEPDAGSRRGRAQDKGGAEAGRDVSHLRPEDIHHRRRERPVREHHTPGAGPDRGGPGGHEGHIDLPGAEIQRSILTARSGTGTTWSAPGSSTRWGSRARPPASSVSATTARASGT